MNLLYPRTVSLHRPATPATATVGVVGYGGVDPATKETVIAAGLPANISYKGRDTANPTDLPTDPRGARYLITLPPRALALGTVHVGDVIVDDTGFRYLVSAPDWQVLGYELQTELLTP